MHIKRFMFLNNNVFVIEENFSRIEYHKLSK
jgi:hypothetical protein